MRDVILIGIDLGKHLFRLQGLDRQGRGLLRMKCNRKQLVEFFANFRSCTVVMEACAGAHHMARRLTAFGHQVKLIIRTACEAGDILRIARRGSHRGAENSL